MNVALKPELAKFVTEQVKAGRYESPEDVVAAAVSRLRQDDGADGFAPGELDALLAEAEAEFRRGEGIDVDAVFAEIGRAHV